MNFRQTLLILRLRWWLILLLMTLVIVGTFVVTINLPKQYTSETVLLLDVKTDPLLAALMPQMASPAYMATQAEIIRSERVAGRVAKILRLDQSPAAVAQWREETEGRIPMESFFGSLLQRGLNVEPGRGSSLLTLTYTGSDPKFAAAAANTFAKAYIDLSVELRVGPAREYGTFFEDRLKTLRADLEAAQTKLSNFQQRKGIVATDGRVDQEMARLDALTAQLAAAQAEQAETSSRQQFAGTETSPDVQQSGVVQGLKAELARAETKLSEISSVVGSNHPQRLQLDAQIGELKKQINSEMGRVSGTTSNFNRVSNRKLGELRFLAEAQKRKVLSLRADRDEISVMQRDVETAQRAFEAVAQRRSQLSLEGQAEQAGARVLSPAQEPLKPSKPRLSVNMAASVVVGLLLAFGVAMAIEHFDRRIRSESDLFAVEGVPVLGVLSQKPAKAWFGRRAIPTALQSPNVPRLTYDGSAR